LRKNNTHRPGFIHPAGAASGVEFPLRRKALLILLARSSALRQIFFHLLMTFKPGML